MADQAVKTETNQAKPAEAKAEPVAPKAGTAKAAEPAKTAEPVKVEAPAPAAKPAVKAAKPRVAARKQPARKAAASARKTKQARPARKRPAVNRKKPVQSGARQLNQGAKIMNKQTKNAAETGQFAADQFRAVFGDVNSQAKTAMERSARIVEELTDLGRGNVEALVASSKVAAKGVETLSQEAADYGRRSFEDASSALKSFAEVKSATDFFRLQSDYARSAFDTAVAESARMSETMIKLAGEVAEPIAGRYTVAAERVKTLAA